MKQFLFIFYTIMTLFTTFYQWIWGNESFRGFFYNFGKGIVWPVVLFPSFGKVVAGLVVLVLVTWVVLSKK